MRCSPRGSRRRHRDPAGRDDHPRRGGVGPPRTRVGPTPHRSIQRLQDEGTARSRALGERDAERGALLDALDEGVIRLDAANRVTEADRRAHTLLGHESGALPGRTLMEAFMDPAVEALATRTRDRSTGAMTVELRPSGADGIVLTRSRTADADRWRPLARPRGRFRAAAAPAHPGRVHRQPVA